MAQNLPGVARAAAPWAACYAAIFICARAAGPHLFAHCKALDGPGRGYWASAAMSVVNGVVLPYLSLKEYAASGIHTSGDFHFTTPGSYAVIYILLGYIAVDSCAIVYYRKAWKPYAFYFHHAATLVGFTVMAVSGLFHNCAVLVVLTEATAPFVHGRWFLSKAGLKQTTLYVVNAVLILLSWFVLRVVMLGWLLWQRVYVQSEAFFGLGQPIVGAFLVIFGLMYALQIYWFWKIVSGLLVILSAGKGASHVGEGDAVAAKAKGR
mgnify:CR=1 FL=1